MAEENDKAAIIRTKVKLKDEQRNKIVEYFHKISPGVWDKTHPKI